MAEYNHRPGANNIFEVTSDEIIEIVLRINDDFYDRYNSNTPNKLKAEEIIELLSSENRICYFQKQKADEKTNKSRHKIIIPIGNERAIEIIVDLWIEKIDTFTDLYSYRVVKLKEINFFNEPTKNTIKRICMFRIANTKEKEGTDAKNFQELYKAVELCEIPIVDINKEKDPEIWISYVNALKKLVKQKETIWKIKDIATPYKEIRQDESVKSNYVDIFIDETEPIKQLKNGISELFDENEFKRCEVSEKKALIEFNDYRELAQDELNQLKELGEDLFYEISNHSPSHRISGRIKFKYSEKDSKEKLYSEIQDKLQNEYELKTTISSGGYIDLNENNIPHLKKIISDNYSHILLVRTDNSIHLKVGFSSEKELQNIKHLIKEKLNSDKLYNTTVTITEDNKYLLVEVAHYIHPNKFNEFGLSHVESITRFKPNKHIELKSINGIELVNKIYQIKNADKDEINNAISLLQQHYPGVRFDRIPTQYFFEVYEEGSIDTRRNFKTKTDLLGKTVFSIENSTLTINSDNKIDYKNQLKRIKESFPSAIIEKKEFNPTFQILFNMGTESSRKDIINKIQNEIRVKINKSIYFEPKYNYTTINFYYEYKTEDKREMFNQAFEDACSEYSQILNYSIENPLGRTRFALIKNDNLEFEKDKEVSRNIRQATFIYLTPEQEQSLSKKIEQFGDDAIYKGGEKIGTLIRKEKNKLKFRISDNFDKIINGRFEDRIELSELREGYIKPIFPGELVNIDRMLRAMKKVTEPNNKNGYPVNQNLPNFLFDPNEVRQSSTDHLEEEKQRVVQNLNEPLLKAQPKQVEAVAKSLVAKDMALIQGPPGTGKTTVIAEIIWQTLLRDPEAKILITSQTNLAVDNALERLKRKKLVRPIRVGTIEKFEDEGKVYSRTRIDNWIQAETDSKEETLHSDNAICQWIENVKEKCSKDEKYATAVSKWKKSLNKKNTLIKKSFSDAYNEYVNVFAATCSECGSLTFHETYQKTFNRDSENKNEPEFDLVIMDEASKATPPELVLPLTLGKKVIIIGDHKQLPPMIDEKEFSEALEAVGATENWERDDYKISQFEKLFKNAPENIVASLDTQFRMHEQIMNCISDFYSSQKELENGLICGIKDKMDIPDFNVTASRWHGLSSAPLIEPKHHTIWVNVETPEEKVGTSYINEGEIKAIQTVLRALTKAKGFEQYQKYFKKDEDKEIGIITYYMPQMQGIKNAMYPEFSKNEWRNFEQHKLENEFQLPFRINTVDRFQGMERNIIIISTVRSNKQYVNKKVNENTINNNNYPYALGFARELQRINVGFSRAKRLLIVIGNEKHFSHKPEYEQAIKKMHKIDIAQIQNLI